MKRSAAAFLASTVLVCGSITTAHGSGPEGVGNRVALTIIRTDDSPSLQFQYFDVNIDVTLLDVAAVEEADVRSGEDLREPQDENRETARFSLEWRS